MEKPSNAPSSPGCYQFFNSKNELLYIGKAANLKSRVLSYWQKSSSLSPAKYSMVKNIARIEYIETDTEIEALLLEANLIKKYQPPYNVVLRDDKRYGYIKISTNEEYPRVYFTRSIDKSGEYFGPFTGAEAVKETLRAIRKIWPYRSCALLPKKPCLYFRLRLCQAPCVGDITTEGSPPSVEMTKNIEYSKNIRQIISFLRGEKKQIIAEYEKKLKELQRNPLQNADKILELQILTKKIKYILASANPLMSEEKYAADVVELAKILNLTKVPQRIEGYDIAHLFGKETVGSMVVFQNGAPDKNEYRKFKLNSLSNEINDVKMLKEILMRRLKHVEWALPDLIIIDGGKMQLNAGQRILKAFNLDIPILSIAKGDGLRSARARDKIFFPGQSAPLVLSLNSPALHIIKRVRDESHRFAITYHKKLRKHNSYL